MSVLILIMLLGGWIFGQLACLIALPRVLGMIIWGIVLGIFWPRPLPSGFEEITPFLKSLALTIILLRAGMNIHRSTLKRRGLIILKMGFFPTFFEALTITGLCHFFGGFPWALAALTGFLLAAVSPAVVIPSMISLREKGYGKENSVPSLLLAAASLDAVVVIVFFTLSLGFVRGGEGAVGRNLLLLPWSLVMGILPALILGFFLLWLFKRYDKMIGAGEKVLLLLGSSMILLEIGEIFHTMPLLGILALGFLFLSKDEVLTKELSQKISQIWVFSEILLFVLLGMAIDFTLVLSAGPQALLFLSCGLLARSLGVLCATAGSVLSFKERFFMLIAYLPKATVQAALGSIIIQENIPQGEQILSYAVLAIVFTAPMGLLGIRWASRFLKNEST